MTCVPKRPRILLVDLKNDNFPQADKDYLSQIVASHTGLSTADASKRVDDTIAELSSAKQKAKEDAEAARKTAMHVSIYVFLSMLVGAFVAATAAALGGRHRDDTRLPDGVVEKPVSITMSEKSEAGIEISSPPETRIVFLGGIFFILLFFILRITGRDRRAGGACLHHQARAAARHAPAA